MRFFRKSLKKRNYKTRVYLLTSLGDTLFFEYKRIKSASSDGRWALFIHLFVNVYVILCMLLH